MDELTRERIQEKRKKDHLDSMKNIHFEEKNGFHAYCLEPTLFPGIDSESIQTNRILFGREFSFPLMINAMTGGFPEGDKLNEMLAELASEFQLPLAVGSQSIAIRFPAREAGYRKIRNKYPDLYLIGNISAQETPGNAKKAVDMLGANALQLHMNCAQEVAMAEGDRDFRDIQNNIKNIMEAIKVPIILKGTGFGMTERDIETAFGLGVQAIDLGGKGGTNFVKIENWRTGRQDGFLEDWGISTYESLLAAKRSLDSCRQDQKPYIIASGGMSKPLDGLKAMGLGADFLGVAGALLKAINENGIDGGRTWIRNYIEDFRKLMLLTGRRKFSK